MIRGGSSPVSLVANCFFSFPLKEIVLFVVMNGRGLTGEILLVLRLIKRFLKML